MTSPQQTASRFDRVLLIVILAVVSVSLAVIGAVAIKQNSQIKDLQSQLDQVSSDVDSVSNDVSDVASDVSSIRSDVSSIQSALP